MSALPNPLQELAEKCAKELLAKADSLSLTVDGFAETLLPILTASVGTLLQAERAAATEHLFLALNLCIETFLIQGMHDSTALAIAQNAVSAHRPADASALSAVVQRETAKLREHLKWALKKGMYVTLTARNERCDHCPGMRARMDWRSTAAEESKWMADVSWHKPDCPYAAAREALK